MGGFWDNLWMFNGNWIDEETACAVGSVPVISPTEFKRLDTYFFPSEISDEIGFSPNYINNLKRLGCHFCGRKTTIRHVRDFLSKRGAELD